MFIECLNRNLPLYLDDKGPPMMLVVGSFYPVGKIRNLAAIKKELEDEAQRDLGKSYSVSARYVTMPPTMEGIELSVTRSDKALK